MSRSLPSLILRIGYSAASRTFFLIISAVSMPIVKVERGAAGIETPQLVDRHAEPLPHQVVQRRRERRAGGVVVGEQRLPAPLGGLELERDRRGSALA